MSAQKTETQLALARARRLRWETKHPNHKSERARRRRRNNPEACREYDKQYRAKHPGADVFRLKEWALANPEAAHKKNIDSYLKNREKVIERSRLWRLRNPAKRCASQALRRLVEKRAMPSWANKFFIDEIYDLACRRTLLTGLSWHVDHIVPLKNKFVCGLHVENNLRVIPWQENIRKSNRLEVALLGNTR